MKKKKVVTIGGGTGSFVLLAGLKNYPIDISAIVSMADNGGSTGRLRDELGVLPPGDARQCLVALSESSQILRELMNYRFTQGDLRGHNFGNLFLSALDKICGGFSKSLEEASRILNVKGEVIPVTESDIQLKVKLKNGMYLFGQTELDHNREVRAHGIKHVALEPKGKANSKALERLKQADHVIIGPGDFYGSIMPNLLVEGTPQAIRKAKAKVIFNCGLTNKKGQTDGFDLDKYVSLLEEYLGRGRINYVTYNGKRPSEDLIKKYEKREVGESLVGFAEDVVGARSFKVVRADLILDTAVAKNRHDLINKTRSFIRHDSEKLARILMLIMNFQEHEDILKQIV